ncbi:MAG: hypothetical protein M0P30_14410 [Syntrophorhabdaceae bacterium]|nr:hypothetical protein [Syntrophorhabdaceae bacterium]
MEIVVTHHEEDVYSGIAITERKQQCMESVGYELPLLADKVRQQFQAL